MLRKNKTIGLIINPIAGMGGKVGLKGTDGFEILERAKKLGAVRESEEKASITVEYISKNLDGIDIEILTFSEDMGENLCKKYNLKYELINKDIKRNNDYKDTELAAEIMLRNNVDLILFAGGDGTARNIYNVIKDNIPVIGIPTGVKIHSAVFAINPKNAGRVAVEFLKNENMELIESEVMDIDENLLKEDKLVAKLYGYMRIPFEKNSMQSLKVGGTSSESLIQEEISRFVVDNMEEDINYIIGPGTSTREIMKILKLPYTLLGVDIVKNKKIILKDATEKEILKIIEKEKVKIIISLVGGQGYIFGRGNHQISWRVLDKVGKENIMIISTANKIISLNGKAMLVDTGNENVDKNLQGYYRVIVGYEEEYVYKCEID